MKAEDVAGSLICNAEECCKKTHIASASWSTCTACPLGKGATRRRPYVVDIGILAVARALRARTAAEQRGTPVLKISDSSRKRQQPLRHPCFRHRSAAHVQWCQKSGARGSWATVQKCRERLRRKSCYQHAGVSGVAHSFPGNRLCTTRTGIMGNSIPCRGRPNKRFVLVTPATL